MRLKQQNFDGPPGAAFSVTALKKLMSDVLSLRERVAQAELEKGLTHRTKAPAVSSERPGKSVSAYLFISAQTIGF
jgi:hypothetical protein